MIQSDAGGCGNWRVVYSIGPNKWNDAHRLGSINGNDSVQNGYNKKERAPEGTLSKYQLNNSYRSNVIQTRII